jgi:AraC-like DNA-binding protein
MSNVRAKKNLRPTPSIHWLIPQAHKCGYRAEALAALCELSSRQLRRRFQERFGRSTQDWLNEQRMVAAVYLLRQTPLVKYVAYELGFKHVGHFSREFKQYHRLTPSEFLKISAAADQRGRR